MRSRAQVGLAVVVVIWGINFSVLKAVLQAIDPLLLNGLRFTLAGVAVRVLLGREATRLPRREDLWRIALLGLVGNTAYQLAFVFGLDRTLAGNGAIILASAPIWTVVMSVLIGQDRGSWALWVATALGAAGIGLVLGDSGQDVSFGSSRIGGDLLVALSAVCWAVYTVAGRPLVQRYGALSVTAWALWLGGIPLIALAVPSALRTPWAEIGIGVWAGVAYAALAAVALAYVLWYRAVDAIGSASTALWSNFVPVVALLVAWSTLGERPGAFQIVGTGLIMLSVRLSWRPARRG